MADSPLDTTQTERPFAHDELFFSTTDRQGRITAWNEVFLRVAGYAPNELLGAPHNVIRHPDMPRCVFQLFWEYLHANRAVAAFVKNRAKTGEYYWVFALAGPIGQEYLSVRIKPSGPLFDAARRLYTELGDVERRAQNWREGMTDARALLVQRLGELGFESYDDFMNAALRDEMRRHLAATKTSDSTLLDGLETVAGLKRTLKRQEPAFDQLGFDINRVAMNAKIRAAHLADRGRALGTISDEVARISYEISHGSKELKTRAPKLAGVLGEVSFSLAHAQLQAEARAFFENEKNSTTHTARERAERYGRDVDSLVSLLTTSERHSVGQFRAAAAQVRTELQAFQGVADTLSHMLLSLQFSYVTGRTLTAQVEGGEHFGVLLGDLMNIADSARGEIGVLRTSVAEVRAEVARWPSGQALETQSPSAH